MSASAGKEPKNIQERNKGGRPKGSLNKATADIKALAQVHGATAIDELVRLMTYAESEAAKVSAIKELLDRAYGKSTQATEANLNVRGALTILTGVPRANGS